MSKRIRKEILDKADIVKVYVFNLVTPRLDGNCYLAVDVDKRQVIYFQQINELYEDAPELDAFNPKYNRVLRDYIREHEELLYKFDKIPSAKVCDMVVKAKKTYYVRKPEEYLYTWEQRPAVITKYEPELVFDVDHCSWVDYVYNYYTEFKNVVLVPIYMK